ncbi:hypothetical protein JA1_002007 [Spathaspora sp. JA1]|nr:hypothetical protein JA1_002007 [Spathaspora sp. JA1]
MLGKVAHIGFDVVLLSGFLAGVKRSTGLTPNLEAIESKDVKYYSQKYLDLGERAFDWSVAYLGSSEYFTRK